MSLCNKNAFTYPASIFTDVGRIQCLFATMFRVKGTAIKEWRKENCEAELQSWNPIFSFYDYLSQNVSSNVDFIANIASFWTRHRVLFLALLEMICLYYESRLNDGTACSVSVDLRSVYISSSTLLLVVVHADFLEMSLSFMPTCWRCRFVPTCAGDKMSIVHWMFVDGMTSVCHWCRVNGITSVTSALVLQCSTIFVVSVDCLFWFPKISHIVIL